MKDGGEKSEGFNKGREGDKGERVRRSAQQISSKFDTRCRLPLKVVSAAAVVKV